MEARFADEDLESLYSDATALSRHDAAVVKAFRKRVQFILAAADERDFRQWKSLHFEKLKGNRADEYSMRLTSQWRLILRFEGKAPRKVVVVVGIEDYH